MLTEPIATLRLNGVEVGKDHAVFTEIARIKQYFAKINKIENPPVPAERENTVNTSAAIRFIRNDLVSVHCMVSLTTTTILTWTRPTTRRLRTS